MKSVIITIIDRNSNRHFDVEVPDDVVVMKLTDDLIQALCGADPSLYWDIDRTVLFSKRMGRELDDSKTLFEEGVWNGDYIYILEK